MLEIAASQHITVTRSGHSTQQDRGLTRIQNYLEERLAAPVPSLAELDDMHVRIDVGNLGQHDAIADPGSTTWDADLVCSLRVYQSSMLLGPLYRPGEEQGPCPLCLERSWQALRLSEEQDALHYLQKVLVFSPNPRLTPFALDFLWQTLEALLTGLLPSVDAQGHGSYVYTLHLDTLQLKRYMLLPDPLCPACSKPRDDTPAGASIQLISHQKQQIDAYHLVKATDYALPVDGYINPLCGVLGKVVSRDYLHEVTSPVTGQFWTWGRYSLDRGWWGGHGNSYRSSSSLAVLEALERYSGFRPRAKTIPVFDSYEHLAPHALDPRTCGLFRPEVYEKLPSIFTPFRPDLQTDWVWGYSLRQERPILVPEQMVYYQDYHQGPAKDHFIVDCSNGCATGSTMEEAIFFGLLELIERDTFLLAWHARLSMPRIDPWSSHNQQTLYLLERIKRLGYDVHLLDSRLDLPIPTIIGIAVRRDDGYGKLLLAAGASLEPEDAIRATLCEVGAYISGFDYRTEKAADMLRTMSHDFTQVTSIELHPLLYGLPEMFSHASFLYQNPQMQSVDETYRQWHAERPRSLNLLDDLNYCLNAMYALGLDVIVVDQSCPQEERVGLKTVSVIVPGLMPISFGYYRERVLQLPRLRTVPRTSGYYEKDFDPALCNITPHPFP